MPGSRRRRTLALAVRTSLVQALSIAAGFDRLADELESGGPDLLGTAHPRAAPGVAPHATKQAEAIAAEYSTGFGSDPWDGPGWLAFGEGDTTAVERPELVRLGDVDVPALAVDAPPVRIPLVIPLLDAANLVLLAPPERRTEAHGAVRGLLTRVLASVPPGELEIIVFDPHELGAGIAGLAPLRAAGLLRPTVTTRADLEATLTGLAADLGRITAERLAGRFPSLRDREDAGRARGEPYRLLVLLGRPVQLGQDAVHALQAVASRGPACGLSVIAVESTADPLDDPGDEVPLARAEILVAGPDGTWTSSLTGGLACRLDPAPPAELVTHVAQQVARAAGRGAATPLDLASMLPEAAPEGAPLWTHDSAAGLSTPIGRRRSGAGPAPTGAIEDDTVTIGFDDDTVHALVGGQAGTGKSTLLLDVVYGLAARYGPDQLRMVLLDFKEGLEFAQFAPRPRDPFALPQADVVAVDSDREYGVAVLRHVRSEMTRRATAMRASGVRSLQALRAADPGSRWPRLLVVIDEFQVLLTPNDGVAREAVGHLETVARQGRAYGIHLLLASQTLSGIDALDSGAGKRGSIFGQFALRIALRTTSAESRSVLSMTNEAAGALVGVGTAVVNRRNGHPDGNEQVRIAHPDVPTIERLRVRLGAATPPDTLPPRLFVGHRPADLDGNPSYAALLTGAPTDDEPTALVGAPLDLDPPAVGVPLAPLPGRHLAVLGPLRREAVGAVQAAARSTAAHRGPGRIHLDLVAASADCVPAVTALAERLRPDGHDVAVHPAAAIAELLTDAAVDVRRREELTVETTDRPPPPLRLLVLLAVDAARATLEARAPGTRSGLEQLRFVTRRGSAQGVHLIGWWRAPDRFLDDLGPQHRDDVAAWVSVGVPAGALLSLADNRPVEGNAGANRALLFDRDHLAAPRTVVPFAPLEGSVPAPATDQGVEVGR